MKTNQPYKIFSRAVVRLTMLGGYAVVMSCALMSQTSPHNTSNQPIFSDPLTFAATSGSNILLGDDGDGGGNTNDNSCGNTGGTNTSGDTCGSCGQGSTQDNGQGPNQDPPTIYDTPTALCTPDQMQTRSVSVVDTDAYSYQELVTNEHYLGSPNDIVADPRKGMETINWAAYRNGVMVAEGVINGDMWIGDHGGYGRGEATISVPGGFDSVVFFSDEVGSDGNLEFVRGVAMVPEYRLGNHRITR